MVYDQSWHIRFGSESSTAAAKILSYIVDTFSPESLIDFGAGAGHWVKTAISLGVKDCTAVDGPWTDPSLIVIDKSLFHHHDLSRPISFNRRYDIALSLEAAQYHDEEGGVNLINTLVKHADKILFSSAVPYQGGDNVTERWQSHWAQLFEDRGYKPFDLIRPQFWNDSEIPYYYRQNIILYVKDIELELEQVKKLQVLDMIHPEKWETLILGSRRERIKRFLGHVFGPSISSPKLSHERSRTAARPSLGPRDGPVANS